MNASELFKAGRLQDAIAAQVKEVKAHPGDAGKRWFLFELLAFAGDLDKARRQLDAIQPSAAEPNMVVLAARHLLQAEEARRRLFREGARPQFFAPAPEHVALRLEAVDRLREGRPDEVRELLDRANGMAPAVPGQLNGEPFEALRDCDDLFGTVLEVMSQGKYYWLPLEQAASLAMNPPRYARDLLWVPTFLQVRDGPAGDAFLPALYPGSQEHADDQVRLGRVTDWKEAEGGPVLGVGLRLFLAHDDAISLLEWREVSTETPGPRA